MLFFTYLSFCLAAYCFVVLRVAFCLFDCCFGCFLAIDLFVVSLLLLVFSVLCVCCGVLRALPCVLLYCLLVDFVFVGLFFVFGFVVWLVMGFVVYGFVLCLLSLLVFRLVVLFSVYLTVCFGMVGLMSATISLLYLVLFRLVVYLVWCLLLICWCSSLV